MIRLFLPIKEEEATDPSLSKLHQSDNGSFPYHKLTILWNGFARAEVLTENVFVELQDKDSEYCTEEKPVEPWR